MAAGYIYYSTPLCVARSEVEEEEKFSGEGRHEDRIGVERNDGCLQEGEKGDDEVGLSHCFAFSFSRSACVVSVFVCLSSGGSRSAGAFAFAGFPEGVNRKCRSQLDWQWQTSCSPTILACAVDRQLVGKRLSTRLFRCLAITSRGCYFQGGLVFRCSFQEISVISKIGRPAATLTHSLSQDMYIWSVLFTPNINGE